MDKDGRQVPQPRIAPRPAPTPTATAPSMPRRVRPACRTRRDRSTPADIPTTGRYRTIGRSPAVTSPTSGLIAANAHSGIAARMPCTPSPQLRSAPIRVSSGPTAAIAGRRFNAIRNTSAAHNPDTGISRLTHRIRPMPLLSPFHTIHGSCIPTRHCKKSSS